MSEFTGLIAGGADCQDLDGLRIDRQHVTLVGSGLAHRLIGRDFSEISVSAKKNSLLKMTITFYCEAQDVPTLREIAAQVHGADWRKMAQAQRLVNRPSEVAKDVPVYPHDGNRAGPVCGDGI